MVISHDERHVSQLTATKRHLEVLCQLVAVAVLLVNAVQHGGRRSRERDGEGEGEGGRGGIERSEVHIYIRDGKKLYCVFIRY